MQRLCRMKTLSFMSFFCVMGFHMRPKSSATLGTPQPAVEWIVVPVAWQPSSSHLSTACLHSHRITCKQHMQIALCGVVLLCLPPICVAAMPVAAQMDTDSENSLPYCRRKKSMTRLSRKDCTQSVRLINKTICSCTAIALLLRSFYL